MKVKFEKIRKSKVRRLTIENNLSPSPTNQSNPIEDEKEEQSLLNGEVEVVELQLEHSFGQSKSDTQDDPDIGIRSDSSKSDASSSDRPPISDDGDKSNDTVTQESNETEVEVNKLNLSPNHQALLISLAESSALSQRKQSSKKKNRKQFG